MGLREVASLVQGCTAGEQPHLFFEPGMLIFSIHVFHH